MGDRVKQTLFAILEPSLRDALVADLFAGSGAGGIEALSRGAAGVWFVERDAGACRVIEENVARAGFAGPAARIVRAEVVSWLAGIGGAAGPFRVVLVDPPYADLAVLEAVLARLGASGAALLTPDAIVVAKHFWRTSPPARVGLLASDRVRRFGETALTFYRLAPDGEA